MCAAFLATLDTYAQTAPYGIVNFANNGLPDSGKIWVGEVGGTGTLAAGTAYHIALYWGHLGTAESALVQTGPAKEFVAGHDGIFVGGTRTLTPLDTYGDYVTVQARAWSRLDDVPDSYESVLAAGLQGDPRAQVGVGPVFDMDTKHPFVGLEPPPTVGFAPGWRGFAITPVPEPSTVALVVLGGAAAILFVRRRNERQT